MVIITADILQKSVRFPNALFFCRLCEFHMDDLKSCISHVQNLRHQRLATEMDFNKFLKTLPMASDAMAEAVGDLILRTSEEVGLSPDDVREREDAVAELQAKLSEAMPGAHLEITGSMYSGLALNTSDVNVSLVLPENVSHCEPLMELLRIINETPTYTDVVNDLRSSTFPCLSYRSEKHGGCRVVIGVGSASMCGVCDQKKGSLPSIAYVVLVVNFLQQTQPPVLPVLSVLCPSGKPEDFPLPKDVKTNFVSKNFQSIGELWLDMVRYFGYIFQFNSHNVSITTTKPSPRLEKNAKKMSILDPFNSKKILSRSLSNSAVSEYIVDKLFKVLCRYFCVPQLSYGQLFFSLTVNDSILKEKRRNCDRQKLSSDSDKNTESETENNKNISDYDLAMDRLEDLKLSDSECEKLTHGISSADDLSHTFDSMTCGEALRCIKLLKPCHLKYAFNQETFTEGESVPIYCSLCQKEGHIRDDCEEEKLPELLPLPDIDAEQDKLLTNLLRRLLHELEPSPEEVEKREKLVEKLQHFVSKEYKYKDAVLQLFGSSANGFGFRNSDLDICITFEDERHKDAIDHNFLIQDLCRILRTSGQFLNVHSIPQAKVPIVKFRCAMTGLDGDLSLYNTLALRNTRLLNIYSQIDPRVKCDICDASRGSLSSYAFSLMLLHFLQHTQPPVLPVLQEVRSLDTQPPVLPVLQESSRDFFNVMFLFRMPYSYYFYLQDDPALSLFDPKILTCGDPPNDRGCRRCGKIGHIVKNCTGRRDADSAGGKKNRGAKGKTDGGRKDVPSDGGAAASGPVKKRDDKCFIGELGMRKIYNACPPDVKCEKIEFAKILDILKKLLVNDQNRVDVLVSGYRVFTIKWFCSLEWKENFTLLVPDELMESREPLVIVRVASRPFGRAEDDYVIGFLKHKKFFDEYVVDMCLEGFDDQPSEGVFLRGLTDMSDERKMRLHQKQQSKRQMRKLVKVVDKNMRHTKQTHLKQADAGCSGLLPVPQSPNSTEKRGTLVIQNSNFNKNVSLGLNKTAPSPAATHVISNRAASNFQNLDMKMTAPESKVSNHNGFPTAGPFPGVPRIAPSSGNPNAGTRSSDLTLSMNGAIPKATFNATRLSSVPAIAVQNTIASNSSSTAPASGLAVEIYPSIDDASKKKKKKKKKSNFHPKVKNDAQEVALAGNSTAKDFDGDSTNVAPKPSKNARKKLLREQQERAALQPNALSPSLRVTLPRTPLETRKVVVVKAPTK
ncbi:hypothetical protein HAZT_HAZT007392 [Hyalella azteca]|uniref:CCHC-type domain-containing protein n=1 Tax=Hyalella azteca TaxID=294128 RepID=A0A6A0GWT3_HYAAZ|nr:hypothetical protein HAZT_HAZT007392 [Hyalella azteca]